MKVRDWLNLAEKLKEVDPDLDVMLSHGWDCNFYRLSSHEINTTDVDDRDVVEILIEPFPFKEDAGDN
jgi:hypothetical protein